MRALLSGITTAALLVMLCVNARAAEWVVGANIGNVPWEFQTADGEFVGFEIDLVKKIAERMGNTVEIVNIPFNGLFSAVQSGRIDIAISSITVTRKRLRSVAFVQPYYDSAQSLTVSANNSLASLDDMRGKVIGVDTGSTGDMWTSSNQSRYGFSVIRRFEGLAPAMLDLQSGRLDGYISDIPALEYFIKGKGHFKIIERIETGERYSMMLAKNNASIDDINEVISQLKSDSYLAELHQLWFGTAPSPSSSTVAISKKPQLE